MFENPAAGEKLVAGRGAAPDRTCEQQPVELLGVPDRFQLLTTREREVMQLVVAGKKTKTIAEKLGVSPRTIDTHRASVMRKMEARSAVDLAAMVWRSRLERAAARIHRGRLKR